MQHRRSRFGLSPWGGVAALLAECNLPVRRTAVPIGRATQVSVLGLPNESFFRLYGTAKPQAEVMAAGDRLRRAQGMAPNAPLPEMHRLAVSGGGNRTRQEGDS